KKLNDYAKALVDTNPVNSVDIEVEHIGTGIPHFKRMYVCLAAVRDGFLDRCRKYLGFDGCFLKGVVKGMLLTAVVAKCANEAQLRQRLDEIDNIQTGAKQSLENKDINQCMPIISMNESIREYLMERRIQRINFASKWRLDYGPNIMVIVNENCAAGCKWKIKWNGAYEFQVYYGRTQHCVHIGDKTCSCGDWQLSGIPCCHATAAIRSRSKNPFDYLRPMLFEGEIYSSLQPSINIGYVLTFC
nr:transposase, MuDR, plant [Tanacetum cinerariifolium]